MKTSKQLQPVTWKVVGADIQFKVMCQDQGYFLTLAQGLIFIHENQNWLFSESSRPFSAKFCMPAFSYEENKIKLHDVGHMTKMTAMPIYVMNLSKYSPEPVDRFA